LLPDLDSDSARYLEMAAFALITARYSQKTAAFGTQSINIQDSFLPALPAAGSRLLYGIKTL